MPLVRRRSQPDSNVQRFLHGGCGTHDGPKRSEIRPLQVEISREEGLPVPLSLGDIGQKSVLMPFGNWPAICNYLIGNPCTTQIRIGIRTMAFKVRHERTKDPGFKKRKRVHMTV